MSATNEFMKKKKKKIRIPKWLQIVAPIIVSGCILIYVAQLVDWNGFLDALKGLKIQTLVLLPVLFFGAIFVQAIKYWQLLPGVSFWPVLRSYMPTNFLFNMPMGIVAGPAFLMYSLKSRINPVLTASTLVLDMYTKVITMFIPMLIGVLFAATRPPSWIVTTVAIVMVSMIGILVLLIYPKTGHWIRRMIGKLGNTRWGKTALIQKLIEAVNQICDAGEMFHRKKSAILTQVCFGVLAELLLTIPYMIIARDVGIGVPWINWLWIDGIVRIFCMFPLTVGGLGAREGAISLSSVWIHQNSGAMLTVSLLYSVVSILSFALFAFVFFWLTPKKDRPKNV